MVYTVAGQTRSVHIVRQPLASGSTRPAIDYTDLWWNPNESGWGMAITQQFSTIFVAWYVYDDNGQPTWLVATCVLTGGACSGSLLQTTGPAFGPTFNPGLVHATAVGTLNLNFTDRDHGAVGYTANGLSGTKVITRQLF